MSISYPDTGLLLYSDKVKPVYIRTLINQKTDFIRKFLQPDEKRVEINWRKEKIKGGEKIENV